MTYRQQIAKLEGENAALRVALEKVALQFKNSTSTGGEVSIPVAVNWYNFCQKALASDAGTKEAAVLQAAKAWFGMWTRQPDAHDYDFRECELYDAVDALLGQETK